MSSLPSNFRGDHNRLGKSKPGFRSASGKGFEGSGRGEISYAAQEELQRYEDSESRTQHSNFPSSHSSNDNPFILGQRIERERSSRSLINQAKQDFGYARSSRDLRSGSATKSGLATRSTSGVGTQGIEITTGFGNGFGGGRGRSIVVEQGIEGTSEAGKEDSPVPIERPTDNNYHSQINPYTASSSTSSPQSFDKPNKHHHRKRSDPQNNMPSRSSNRKASGSNQPFKIGSNTLNKTRSAAHTHGRGRHDRQDHADADYAGEGVASGSERPSRGGRGTLVGVVVGVSKYFEGGQSADTRTRGDLAKRREMEIGSTGEGFIPSLQSGPNLNRGSSGETVREGRGQHHASEDRSSQAERRNREARKRGRESTSREMEVAGSTLPALRTSSRTRNPSAAAQHGQGKHIHHLSSDEEEAGQTPVAGPSSGRKSTNRKAEASTSTIEFDERDNISEKPKISQELRSRKVVAAKAAGKRKESAATTAIDLEGDESEEEQEEVSEMSDPRKSRHPQPNDIQSSTPDPMTRQSGPQRSGYNAPPGSAYDEENKQQERMRMKDKPKDKDKQKEREEKTASELRKQKESQQELARVNAAALKGGEKPEVREVPEFAEVMEIDSDACPEVPPERKKGSPKLKPTSEANTRRRSLVADTPLTSHDRPEAIIDSNSFDNEIDVDGDDNVAAPQLETSRATSQEAGPSRLRGEKRSRTPSVEIAAQVDVQKYESRDAPQVKRTKMKNRMQNRNGESNPQPALEAYDPETRFLRVEGFYIDQQLALRDTTSWLLDVSKIDVAKNDKTVEGMLFLQRRETNQSFSFGLTTQDSPVVAMKEADTIRLAFVKKFRTQLQPHVKSQLHFEVGVKHTFILILTGSSSKEKQSLAKVFKYAQRSCGKLDMLKPGTGTASGFIKSAHSILMKEYQLEERAYTAMPEVSDDVGKTVIADPIAAEAQVLAPPAAANDRPKRIKAREITPLRTSPRAVVPAPFDPDTMVCVWPPPGTGRVEVNITKGDVYRLEEHQYLNDTLIEFGLKNIVSDPAGIPSEDVHVFNSFFYKKISDKNKTAARSFGDKILAQTPSAAGPWEAYETVKKWTAKTDIFAKKFIIVPVCENLHWYLIVIYNPAGVLKQEPAQEKDKTDAAEGAAMVPDLVRISNAGSGGRNSDQDASSDSASTPAKADETIDDELGGGMYTEMTEFGSQDRMNTVEAEVPVARPNAKDCADQDPLALKTSKQEVEEEPEPTYSPVRIPIPGNIPTHMPDSQALRDRFGQASGLETRSSSANRSEPAALGAGDGRQAQPPPPRETAPVMPADSCVIMSLDSIGGQHKTCATILNRWLAYEAQQYRGVQIAYGKEEPAWYQKVTVPQQRNFSDCGVYLLHYVRQLLAKEVGIMERLIERWTTAEDKEKLGKLAPEQDWSASAAQDGRELWKRVIEDLRVAQGGKPALSPPSASPAMIGTQDTTGSLEIVSGPSTSTNVPVQPDIEPVPLAMDEAEKASSVNGTALVEQEKTGSTDVPLPDITMDIYGQFEPPEGVLEAAPAQEASALDMNPLESSARAPTLTQNIHTVLSGAASAVSNLLFPPHQPRHLATGHIPQQLETTARMDVDGDDQTSDPNGYLSHEAQPMEVDAVNQESLNDTIAAPTFNIPDQLGSVEQQLGLGQPANRHPASLSPNEIRNLGGSQHDSDAMQEDDERSAVEPSDEEEEQPEQIEPDSDAEQMQQVEQSEERMHMHQQDQDPSDRMDVDQDQSFGIEDATHQPELDVSGKGAGTRRSSSSSTSESRQTYREDKAKAAAAEYVRIWSEVDSEDLSSRRKRNRTRSRDSQHDGAISGMGQDGRNFSIIGDGSSHGGVGLSSSSSSGAANRNLSSIAENIASHSGPQKDDADDYDPAADQSQGHGQGYGPGMTIQRSTPPPPQHQQSDNFNTSVYSNGNLPSPGDGLRSPGSGSGNSRHHMSSPRSGLQAPPPAFGADTMTTPDHGIRHGNGSSESGNGNGTTSSGSNESSAGGVGALNARGSNKMEIVNLIDLADDDED